MLTTSLTNNTYTIGDQIGEGAFSIVFSCVDEWGNQLAAKVLKPHGTYDAVKEAAVREFQTLRELRNPNITFVYDAFEFDHAFYIITEKGELPLASAFQVPNLDGRKLIIPIARNILQAVHYLHLNHYAHQDIHVGNIFAFSIRDEFEPENSQKWARKFKLGDLGIAKLFHEIATTNLRAQDIRPPEVRNPSEFGAPDHRADIYHLGLVFLQLALGRQMTFSDAEILAGRPRELALALAQPFNFALEKSLRRHVAARTASAKELWRDLNSPAAA